MLYNVHLYPIFHLEVRGVEAVNQEEAIRKAESSLDLCYAIGQADFTGDVESYLVDEQGDETYANSRWHRCQDEGLTQITEKG